MDAIVGWARLALAIVIPVSSIWVFFDGKSINERAYNVQQANEDAFVERLQPAAWALGAFFLWIVIFPWYLVERGKLLRQMEAAEAQTGIAKL